MTLVQAYKSGLTTHQVARQFKCSPSTVLYKLRKAGCERRAPGIQKGQHRKPHDDAAFRLAVAEGLTMPELAQRFGLSTTNISRWKRRLGLQTRRPRKAPHRRERYLTVARGSNPEPKLFRCRCGAVAEDKRALEVCVHREGA